MIRTSLHPLAATFELVLDAGDAPKAGVLPAGGRIFDTMKGVAYIKQAYSTGVEDAEDVRSFGKMNFRCREKVVIVAALIDSISEFPL